MSYEQSFISFCLFFIFLFIVYGNGLIFPQAKPYSRVFGDYENTPSNWTVRYLDPSVSEDKRFLDEMTVLSNIAKLVRIAAQQHIAMETALCVDKYRTYSNASTLLFSSGGVWTCVQGWCA